MFSLAFDTESQIIFFAKLNELLQIIHRNSVRFADNRVAFITKVVKYRWIELLSKAYPGSILLPQFAVNHLNPFSFDLHYSLSPPLPFFISSSVLPQIFTPKSVKAHESPESHFFWNRDKHAVHEDYTEGKVANATTVNP